MRTKIFDLIRFCVNFSKLCHDNPENSTISNFFQLKNFKSYDHLNYFYLLKAGVVHANYKNN